MFATALRPLRIIEVSAHCDPPCGVYDPAQARIEAESIKAIDKKVADSDDPDFRVPRHHQEQRAPSWSSTTSGAVDRLLLPPHFEKFPELHSPHQRGDKLAGASGTRGSFDESVADELLAKIDRVAEIFAETKKA